MVEEVNFNKSLIRSVAIAGLIISTIQALAWIVLAFLAIAYYFDAIGPNNDASFGSDIYFLFLSKKGSCLEEIDNVIIKPEVFAGILWFYGFFSVVWILLSSYLLRVMILEKFRNVVVLFWVYGAMLILICLVDAAFVGILTSDYVQLDKWLSSIEGLGHDSKQVVLVTHGIVFSIAARGYVLWVVNLIFGIIFIKFACNTNECKNEHQQHRQIIDAYDTPATDNFNNWGFQDSANPYYGSENLGFERSESFYPAVDPFSKPYKLPKPGKKIKAIPPPVLPKNGPYIPEPDYTPPGSPTTGRNRLKGVLKTNPTY